MIGRLLIYATRKDWLFLLSELESTREVRYGLDPQDRGSEVTTWSRAVDIPNLGLASGTDTVRCSRFKIFRNAQDGGDGMDADLWPGGEYDSKTIISWTITTIFDDPRIQRIMRKLASLLKKHFTRVHAYWVGPEAIERLRAGSRLTLNVYAGPEFDLHKNSVGSAS